MTNWYVDYIGIPWKKYASGPDYFDCWGLVHHCLSDHFDIISDRFLSVESSDSRAFDKVANQEIYQSYWRQVDEPLEGDVVLMSRKRLFHHVGIFTCGKVLHTREGSDVCLEKVRDLSLAGFTRIEFYRYDRIS